MFKELLPMVRYRKVTIIIKHNEDDTLTVNVLPIQIRPDENPALCTPLSDTGVTGTAEDFDRDVAKLVGGVLVADLVEKGCQPVIPHDEFLAEVQLKQVPVEERNVRRRTTVQSAQMANDGVP